MFTFLLLLFVTLIAVLGYALRKLFLLKQELNAKELDSRFEEARRGQSDSREHLTRKIEALEKTGEENVKYLESNWQRSLDALDLRVNESIVTLERKVDENVAELQRRIDDRVDGVYRALDAVVAEVNALKATKKK